MRSLSTSKKRHTKEFAPEIQFQPKKTRRGGQTLKPVPIQTNPPLPLPVLSQNTSQPSGTAPSSSRKTSPSSNFLDHNDGCGEIDGTKTGHKRRNPGQVNFHLILPPSHVSEHYSPADRK
jgi:hypothetical protein